MKSFSVIGSKVVVLKFIFGGERKEKTERKGKERER
jgi:hypothetical protein